MKISSKIKIFSVLTKFVLNLVHQTSNLRQKFLGIQVSVIRLIPRVRQRAGVFPGFRPVCGLRIWKSRLRAGWISDPGQVPGSRKIFFSGSKKPGFWKPGSKISGPGRPARCRALLIPAFMKFQINTAKYCGNKI